MFLYVNFIQTCLQRITLNMSNMEILHIRIRLVFPGSSTRTSSSIQMSGAAEIILISLNSDCTRKQEYTMRREMASSKSNTNNQFRGHMRLTNRVILYDTWFSFSTLNLQLVLFVLTE